MIPSGNRGWQTTIADLALILFMISAAALAQGDDTPAMAAAPAPAPVLENPLPAMAEPVAIYRAGRGMPAIDDWLAGQAPDSRLQLTIIAHYTPANAAGAAATALQMADAARAGGWPARNMGKTMSRLWLVPPSNRIRFLCGGAPRRRWRHKRPMISPCSAWFVSLRKGPVVTGPDPRGLPRGAISCRCESSGGCRAVRSAPCSALRRSS